MLLITGLWVVQTHSSSLCPQGNSIVDQETPREFDALHQGLCQWLGSAYKSENAGFAIGKQQDRSSCGVCVLNAMEHAMLGTALFTHANRSLVRMGLFVKLAAHLLGKVGALCPVDS